MRTLAIVLLVAACGGGSSGNGNIDATKSADAKVFMDAPPVVPTMITIAGTAKENGQNTSTPLAGATVSLLKTSDDSMIATATSAADGTYSFTVTTNGAVVDAYVKATKSGYEDAAAYPASPFQTSTTSADSNLVTTSNYGLLRLISGQQPGMGFVVVEILDASNNPVQGVVATSTPAGTYKYSDSNMTPTATTSTNTDGTAFVTNLAPGKVTLGATKAGSTFKSHIVNAKADQFTSTVVTE